MKKKWLTASSLVAVSALSILGTKAYLTSTDTDLNVMTNGNVKIQQLEYERVIDENGDFTKEFQRFTSGKKLYPVAKTPGLDSEMTEWTDISDGFNRLLDPNVKNVQDKFVFVENTGKDAAYYRTIIAFEAPEGFDAELIHFNVNETSYFDWNSTINESQDFGEARVLSTTINGTHYYVYEVTYTEELLPGQTSRPSLLQVYLDPKATNEDVEKLGDTFDIIVTTQAVQAAGFEDPNIALNSAFGDIAQNDSWKNTSIISAVSTGEEMRQSVAEGKEVIMISDIKVSSTQGGYHLTGIAQTNGGIIDGGNHILTVNGANGTWDSGIYTKGGTIKNINVKGGFRSIFISEPTEDIIIDNVNVNSDGYSLNVDSETGGHALIVTDSTLNGWTSYSDVFSSVTFTNCLFGKGSNYAYFRPYGDTTMINCDFDVKNGYKIDTTEAEVTLIDCTINGEAITSQNIHLLGADAVHAIIK